MSALALREGVNHFMAAVKGQGVNTSATAHLLSQRSKQLGCGTVCMRASDSRLSPGFVRLHYQLENYQNLVHYFGVVLSMETGYSI